MSLVGKDHKIGYTDHDGNIIVPLIYDEGLFQEGYAAVRKGDKWQYIDSTGKAITEPVFNDAQSFHDGLAAAMKGDNYGYIDYAGKTVIDFHYQWQEASPKAWYRSPTPGTCGVISTARAIITFPQYDFADGFDNGEARIIKGDKIIVHR